MSRKAIIIVLSLFISHLSSFAHASWEQHADDMYQVFGFERNEELTDWMKFVSSVLIDNNNTDCAFGNADKPFDFYSYLQEKYPDFKCKHRLLFHWGYNSRPWSTYLEEKVHYYGWTEKKIKNFQTDLIAEQKRRNGYANEYTENVFGYAHGGKEARIARVLISTAYDVHLLGDYEPDNSDLDGLQDIESIVGDIINNLTALDKQNSSTLCKQLKVASKKDIDVQNKATIILDILKENFCTFLYTADNGNIAEHLCSKGFRFEDGSDVTPKIEESSDDTPNIEEEKPVKEQQRIKEKRKHSQNSEGLGFVIVLSLSALGMLLALLFKKRK